MKFLVDANVLVYAVMPGPRREPSLEALEQVAEGRAEGLCTVAVIEELWHLELTGRIAGLDGQARRAIELFSPLLAVDEQTLRLAQELDATEIGANDRLHVASCLQHGIERILSADRALDEITRPQRVDPLDAEALRELLGD